MQSDQTVVNAFVQRPAIADLWGYIEQLLSRVGRSRLLMIAQPLPFNRTGRAVYFSLVAVAKEVVLWTRHEDKYIPLW